MSVCRSIPRHSDSSLPISSHQVPRMNTPPARTIPSVDVGHLLDEGPYTIFQKIVVLLAAMSIVMDGFDGQLIGFAIPVIIKEWGITRGAFAPAVAAGLIGMAIGSAFAGL